VIASSDPWEELWVQTGKPETLKQYQRSERWSFRTAKTLSRHRPDKSRNAAPPAVPERQTQESSAQEQRNHHGCRSLVSKEADAGASFIHLFQKGFGYIPGVELKAPL
jgi:hypothetical protein